MWWGKEEASAPPSSLPRLPRSQSHTGLRSRRSGEALPAHALRRPRHEAPAWQRITQSRAGSLPRVRGQLPLECAEGKGTRIPAVALDEAGAAKEVMCVGLWSVRQVGAEGSLIYVNKTTGCAQVEPPREVLAELGIPDDGVEDAPPASTSSSRRGSRPGSRPQSACRQPVSCEPVSFEPVSCDNEEEEDANVPHFSRIVLGANNEVPLAMARDILAAVREDSTLFNTVRERYSCMLNESTLEFGSSLPAELESEAMKLGLGEISEVIGTDAGMQILLRVC